METKERYALFDKAAELTRQARIHTEADRYDEARLLIAEAESLTEKASEGIPAEMIEAIQQATALEHMKAPPGVN